MDEPITGGCRCGAIRYAYTQPPTLKHMCCCRDCQRFTGAGKVFVVGGPRAAFVLEQGEPASYAVIADSGATIVRAFCPTCGSPLFIYPEIDGVYYTADDDVIEVTAGSLDDPSAFTPDFAVFVSRAPRWATFPEGLPLHD